MPHCSIGTNNEDKVRFILTKVSLSITFAARLIPEAISSPRPNAAKEAKSKYSLDNVKVGVVNAKKIALETIGVPIVNTTMIGAFLKATGILKVDSVSEAVRERFKGKAGENTVKAVRRAYEEPLVEG